MDVACRAPLLKLQKSTHLENWLDQDAGAQQELLFSAVQAGLLGELKPQRAHQRHACLVGVPATAKFNGAASMACEADWPV
jgi:hypothetical protein